jgi:thiol peroxidase
MATITFKGAPAHTSGRLPAVGSEAPDFSLTDGQLADAGPDRYAGRRKLLSIVPSLDTGVCAASARRFNEAVSRLPNMVLLNVSADLPFAQRRFCESEGLSNVVTLSSFRSPSFGEDYGVRIMDGPLAGLLARAVVVIDEDGLVVYTELVPEIGQEPDYEAALAAAG